jgi:hypothetical protein
MDRIRGHCDKSRKQKVTAQLQRESLPGGAQKPCTRSNGNRYWFMRRPMPAKAGGLFSQCGVSQKRSVVRWLPS